MLGADDFFLSFFGFEPRVSFFAFTTLSVIGSVDFDDRRVVIVEPVGWVGISAGFSVSACILAAAASLCGTLAWPGGVTDSASETGTDEVSVAALIVTAGSVGDWTTSASTAGTPVGIAAIGASAFEDDTAAEAAAMSASATDAREHPADTRWAVTACVHTIAVDAVDMADVYIAGVCVVTFRTALVHRGRQQFSCGNKRLQYTLLSYNNGNTRKDRRNNWLSLFQDSAIHGNDNTEVYDYMSGTNAI